MSSKRPFSRLLSRGVVSGAALVGIAAVAFAFVCRSGTGSGVWDLPPNSSTAGSVSGQLFESGPSTLPLAAYDLFAELKDVPTPCLSCITGTINGFLDDGHGPAPDYILRGTYSGLFLNGSGTFHCDVYAPGGSTVSVGKIDGNFSDPPASTSPGHFTANWKICP